MVERVTEAGATDEQVRPLGSRFPSGVFSLSHVALPFPIDDALYGLQPDPTEISASISARSRRAASAAR